MAEPTAALLQRLADTRLAEAETLLAARQPSGAYYLAGYAVECGLEAIIAKSFRARTIPDRSTVDRLHTHDPDKLLALADLRARRDARAKADIAFAKNWTIVVSWRQDSRYRRVTFDEARSLIEAIGHPDNGILPWLRTFW